MRKEDLGGTHGTDRIGNLFEEENLWQQLTAASCGERSIGASM